MRGLSACLPLSDGYSQSPKSVLSVIAHPSAWTLPSGKTRIFTTARAVARLPMTSGTSAS